jgi:hypothetical protein
MVLTERLNHRVEQGVIERKPYDARPRYEYHLTAKGAELVDLLMVMVRWGDKWLAGEDGPPVLYRHHTCGEISSRPAVRALRRTDARRERRPARWTRRRGTGQLSARPADPSEPLDAGVPDGPAGSGGTTSTSSSSSRLDVRRAAQVRAAPARAPSRP